PKSARSEHTRASETYISLPRLSSECRQPKAPRRSRYVSWESSHYANTILRGRSTGEKVISESCRGCCLRLYSFENSLIGRIHPGKAGFPHQQVWPELCGGFSCQLGGA